MRRSLLLAALIAVFLFALMAGTGLAAATILLGSDSVASSQDNDAAGLAEAFNFSASASGSAQSISVYVDSGSSASGLAVGLYAEDNGHPGSLLGSGSNSAATAGQWNQVTLNSTLTLSSGTTYWLAVLGTGGRLNFRDVDLGTGSCSENSSQSNLTSLPSRWTSGATFTTCSLSAYVNGPATSTTTSAPANTALPTISGEAVQGQPLTATNGSWSDSPTGYAYQWQDCDSSANSCTNIPGANNSSYLLASSDINHTIRVLVVAANSAGSTSGTSAATAVVTAAPAASFTYSPVSPVTGQTVHFDGTASTCAATPCSYSWADDPPAGGTWPLGSGQTLDFTFRDVGTKYVTLTVTDALHRSASVEHNVVMTAGAPTNTALPAISGTAQQGDTLTASTGRWTSTAPISYTYRWSDGALGSTHTLTAADVGQNIYVTVTASNIAGNGQATSTSLGPVTASGGGGGTDCFASPGVCGYPDPNYNNVGVPAGTMLTPSGSINVTTDGSVINGMDVTGSIYVNANDVTIENTRVTNVGGGCGPTTTCGNADIYLRGPYNVTITHDELTTDSGTTVEHAIRNGEGGTIEVDHVYQHGNTDALCWCGNATLKDNYSLIHLAISLDHLENTYSDGATVDIEHNVLENTNSWVANIFANINNGAGGACNNHLTVKDNLLAGGGYTIYPCAHGTSVGSSTLDFENNRFARCHGPQVQGPDGTWDCQGGADRYGLFPNGGAYGVDKRIYCPPTPGQTWANNVWDDNNAVVGC